jgi:hypothetical protein
MFLMATEACLSEQSARTQPSPDLSPSVMPGVTFPMADDAPRRDSVPHAILVTKRLISGAVLFAASPHR